MDATLAGIIGTISGILISSIVQWILFGKQQKTAFRLAALEKRLAVHQEAYILWTELLGVIHKPDNSGEKHSVIIKAQDWWNRNCLYLDPISRKEFKNCYMDVSIYDCYREDTNELKSVFKKIMKTPEYLAQGVNLSTDSDTEMKMTNKINANGN